MTTLHVAAPAESAAANPDTPADGLSDIELLHQISTALIGEQDLDALYATIVDAAVSITGSQFGTMQLLCPPGHPSGRAGQLQLLCSRGLSPEAAGFWQWVPPTAYSSCTAALKSGQRSIIPDFEQWPDIAGTEDLDAFRRTGIRSAQTTPLHSRKGALLGMISTHWAQPHYPTERDLRLLDILARQAADLLERTIAQEALRSREQELIQTCNALRETEELQRQTEAQLLALNDSLERRVSERSAELLLAEEKLRQAQKMEAVGQLTGGLAHDFNNLLAGIGGSLELMSRRIAQGRVAEVGNYLATAQGATLRAASLTHRLLAFSRRQTLDPRPTNVNTLVQGMTELIQRTVGPGISVTTQGAGDLWPALVDAGQLENALLNLAINARDAMPSGGQISIHTRNLRLGRVEAAARDTAEGEYLCLSVGDTGAGMSPHVMERAYEPFFTTKPIGQGTGLGLSMIYGFARQSGGQVHIESAVGQGCTVHIYLPRYLGEAPGDELQSVAAPVVSALHSETILLVDDEPTLRMLLMDALSEAGYTVIEAADSLVGLTLLRSDMPIDLLITDVGLPGGMNGRQMAEAGLELRPGLKTLFITGYAEHASFSTDPLPAHMHVLAKPFSINVLGERVRELLSGS